nr:uncharacterized protein LOC129263286 [Lytechinus pictus]
MIDELHTALDRGDLHTVVHHVTSSPLLRSEFNECLSKEISAECSYLCGIQNNQSTFRNKSKEALQEFSFDKQEAELKEKAPVLLTCLQAAATNPRLDKRKSKSSRTIIPGVLAAAGTVLYLRNREMNASQTLTSLALKRGGASSKTFARLQGRGLSVSYKSTLRRQTHLGEGFDAEVKQWKEEVEEEARSEKELRERLAKGDVLAASELESLNASRHPGYILNGDNVDVKVKPRQASMEDKGQDLHFYQFLAVKNRIADFSLSDVAPAMNVEDASLNMFLPSPEDNNHLRDEWATLVARVVTQNIPALSWMAEFTETKIKHEYMDKTKQKSTVVNLGVITENENTHEGIVAILDKMNAYIPMMKDSNVQIPTLSGGDLLTCERQVNAKKDRQDSTSSASKWEGVIPVIDDFHAMANFLEVIWKVLYSTKSARDPGTLYASRNFLRATNVPASPLKDVNASVEFLTRYSESLIVAAALHHFGMEDVNSQPTRNIIDKDSTNVADEVKEQLGRLVDRYAIHEGPHFDRASKFVCPLCNKEYVHQRSLQKHTEQQHSNEPSKQTTSTNTEDSMFNYSSAALGMCLLWMDFEDARKYGDGARIIRLYKYFVLYFKLEGKTKYALHSLRLLAQVKCLLSPRLAHQLIWNRVVNNVGKEDTNVELDRENEHHNRIFKEEYRQFHGKVSKASVARVSHSAQTSEKILTKVDEGTQTRAYKGAHKKKDLSEDVQRLAHHMHREQIFSEKDSRHHHAFPSFPLNPLSRLNLASLRSWMSKKLKDFAF